ncbi:putative rubber elongation factor [Rosa chinensis]|uniref:Putative rubber elongation factor n=1 Tax=Rosa chinensis TaxID=74649 RepID=A0A2P6RYI5_ROSCH|nr:putative rubber elongation factor [Rosa chinensis]
MAVIYIMMFVLNLYEYAKKNLGHLRSIVWTVEFAMINIVAPIYQRFEGVPDDFLGLLNMKCLYGWGREKEYGCYSIRICGCEEVLSMLG